MKLAKTAKILIVGGHLTPALAVLEELKAEGYQNFIWVGVKHSQTASQSLSAEYKIVTGQKIKFIDFKAGKLWRKWTVRTFWKGIYNLLLIPWGIVSAIRLIATEKPQLVLSFGGYMAFPVVFASRIMGIKSATHEQTMAMGMANRMIARFASVVLLSWPENKKELSSGLQKKSVITGNPVRKSLLKVTTSEFKFKHKHPLIYVTGGNQGANTINWRLFEILPRLLPEANVIHQVGNSSVTHDLKKAEAVWKKLPAELQEKYRFYDNIYGPAISEVMHKAMLVVSRSGANSVTDIMCLGKPAVLIPIPWSAHQEQEKNAELVAGTGLGMILKQYDAMPPEELLAAIKHALTVVSASRDFKGRELETAVREAKKKVQPEAALKIVEIVTNL